MAPTKMPNSQGAKIPPWLQPGQRVRISDVPSAIKNLAVGATGVVVGKPLLIRGNIVIELLLDNGRKLAWKLDALKPIMEEIEANVEVVEELTPEEESDRLQLEGNVKLTFYSAGRALRELRDRRLYRSTHSTFGSYCREKFGFGRRHPYRLISAAEVVDNIRQLSLTDIQAETEEEIQPTGPQILPTSERQVRPLTKLEPPEQLKAWEEAVQEAGGKVPNRYLVEDVALRIQQKTPVPNPYQVGDICELVVKGNQELRGQGGCWCIVESVHDFSCTVRTWLGSHQVKIENLQSLDLIPEQQQRLQQLLSRLIRLQQVESVESIVLCFLSELGQKTMLTELEDKILEFVENYYDKIKNTSF